MTKILAVDDNEVIREVLKFSLQDKYYITTAEGGKEAIALAEASYFDVIITDVNMPGMSGVEFVTELRKIKAYARTPIVVVTANISVLKQEMDDAGATDWIVKPFEPAKLLEVIEKALKQIER